MSMMQIYLANQARCEANNYLNIVMMYKKLTRLLLKDRNDTLSSIELKNKRYNKIENLIKEISQLEKQVYL